MTSRRCICSILIAALVFVASAVASVADPLTREKVQEFFPSPLVVGQQDDKLPIWKL